MNTLPFCFGNKFAGVIGVRCQGFFAHHVEAAPQGRDCVFVMKTVRGGDNHAIQIRNLQELLEVFCGHFESELAFDTLQLVGANAAYRCELNIIAISQCWHVVGSGPPASSNEPKSGGA